MEQWPLGFKLNLDNGDNRSPQVYADFLRLLLFSSVGWLLWEVVRNCSLDLLTFGPILPKFSPNQPNYLLMLLLTVQSSQSSVCEERQMPISWYGCSTWFRGETTLPWARDRGPLFELDMQQSAMFMSPLPSGILYMAVPFLRTVNW